MTIVLRRDENGREVLWKCSSCGQPFDLGWGDQCNACLTAERRHRELVAAVQHIDSDRTIGPSDWDRECQESGRLNR